MARVDGLFKNLQLGPADAEAGRPLLSVAAPTGALSFVPAKLRKLGRFDYFRTNNTATDFDTDGAVDVGCRFSVVVICLAKLSATGLIAFVASFNATSAKLALGCALSTAVCAIAAGYYTLIVKVRSQTLETSVFKKVALALVPRRRTGASGAPDEPANDGELNVRQKALVQEVMVDSLRANDWLTSLPLMTIELYFMSTDANPSGSDDGLYVGPILGSFLVGLMVSVGVSSKAYFHSLRKMTAADGSRVEQPCANWAIAVLSFVVSLGLFVLVNADILLRTGWPRDAPEGPMRDDRTYIHGIVWVQVGYPLVWALEFLALRCMQLPEDEYPNSLSFAKDLALGTLDVSAKGSLAFIAALRAVR